MKLNISGLCIRLYSEDDFTNFQPYTTPELQRVSLDAVVLQMAAMGVNDPKTFPFLEPPSENAINSAVTLLQVDFIAYSFQKKHDFKFLTEFALSN